MTRVYVGNLPIDVRERELDDLFYKYGRIRDIDIKRPIAPPAFAFITYDDHRDASDAVYGRDGYNFDGNRLRCEIAKDSRGGGGDRYGGRGGGGGGGGGGGDKRGGVGRRSDYGVVVSGLPKSCSWQDLKDVFRKAGDVVFTDVNRDSGEGVVEFSTREDMENAVRKMDDSEFRNRFDDRAIMRVRLRDGAADGGSGSCSGAGGDRDREDRDRDDDRRRDDDDDERRDREREDKRDRRGDAEDKEDN